MLHLAGSKIRAFRRAATPKLSCAAFGLQYGGGAPGQTVRGWEQEGKRPRDPQVVNRLAQAGIAEHADWTLPAECPRCHSGDTAAVGQCPDQRCPLNVRQVA